jgi:mannose-1-phosphate guanylyltransferase/mannose-6-phosphate isomerase
MAVYPVIMCGGSGTRLWPASRPARPKQFVPLTGARSSFQDTVLRVIGLTDAAPPLIVAGVPHRASILAQLAELGVEGVLLLEPEGRDSAAAMAAAAAWIKLRDPLGVAVVVSADHDVPDDVAFRAAVEVAIISARAGSIVTLGVRPTAPSPAFGYIRAAEGEGVQPVAAFVEKPDVLTAKAYVEAGYLWNSGNFVVAAAVLADELAAHAPETFSAAKAAVGDGKASDGVLILGEAFRTAPKISIDYAVMEKTKRAEVLAVDFAWSDVGAWDAVWAASAKSEAGNAASGAALFVESSNSLVRAPAGVQVAVVGLKDVAVVVDGDDILVCDLSHSQSVKAAVDQLKSQSEPPVFADLAQANNAYQRWLRVSALPLWWAVGADHERGGFIEALSVEGDPRPAPRRGRVQGRQVFTYGAAGELGWQGPWRQAAWHGLNYALERFQRSDGLFRTLLSADGEVLDDSAAVYDQAFALLGMATLHRLDPGKMDLVAAANHLRDGLQSLRHTGGGFKETSDHPFQSNCHMHILEASLAWSEAGDASWDALADEIVGMAMSIFIDPQGGFLREFFDADWRPAPGDDGRLVEPGHQFEWAWLLERWGRQRGDGKARAAARKLFQIGRKGVDPVRGVAVNALRDDFSIRDANARLWPQTEYLKAALILGEEDDALVAANGLWKYLQTPAQGVWFDKMAPDGTFVDEPAPASSFYHIICAIAELSRFQAARN